MLAHGNASEHLGYESRLPWYFLNLRLIRSNGFALIVDSEPENRYSEPNIFRLGYCVEATQKTESGKGSKIIEAAKVVVPIGKGEEVRTRAIAAGLRAFTEPYREDGLDEVLVHMPDEAAQFEESLLVEAIGETQYSEVQVFVPDSQVRSAEARLQELGIPSARQLSETDWAPGATYETRY